MAQKLRITQVRSAAKLNPAHRRTLQALGIRKNQQTVEQTDTPQIRGMIHKIVHLLKVEEV